MFVQGGNQQRGCGTDVQIGWMRRGPVALSDELCIRHLSLGVKVHVFCTDLANVAPANPCGGGPRGAARGRLGEAAAVIQR